MSLVENESAGGTALIHRLLPATGRAHIIGITGPPGAGKSTIVNALVDLIRATGETVGVIAVDPTSPFTGGAVLGDRVRMTAHAADPGVFVRSMATRGNLGGLARATGDVAVLMDAAGFNVVLIETVGVGQDEVDIVRAADTAVVLLVPGAGDDVQAIKAGIMEIADVFVVNKADREGADQLVQAIRASQALGEGGTQGHAPVLKTVAATGDGVADLWTFLRARRTDGARRQTRRAALEARVVSPPVSPQAGMRGGTATRAVLDHVGVAVRDVESALAFYRDALGIAVDGTEVVADQKVTAHFLDTGGARLELLEPTSPDSVIARYLERRGPGLHHITLRVADIDDTLARLKQKGVSLIDEAARTGAEGTRIAFIHPASAHGVLVELKEGPRPASDLHVRAFDVGALRVTLLHDGLFRLDGGAMFGVVPRMLWERKAPADDRHRIQLAMRPALVEGDWGRLLIDCGAGDKFSDKERDIYAFERERHLDHALADAGLSSSDIPLVLPTHLHFDHFGGATERRADGVGPRFPNARYAIRRAEWEDATHPHERNRASYLCEDFVPLLDAGVVDFYEDDHEVRPGVRIERTGGHTGQHQMVFIESHGQTAVFAADIIPTTAHIQDPWVMGYDLFPMETLAVKRRLIRDAVDREFIVIFEHDPVVAAGYIRERDGRRYVEALRYTN